MTFAKDGDQIEEESPGMELEVRYIFLEDFEFRNHDYNRGSEEFYVIPSGEIEVDEMDLDHKKVSIGKTDLYDLSVTIHVFNPESNSLSVNEPEEEEYDSDEAFDSTHVPFVLGIQSISINDGTFKLDNFARTPLWAENYKTMDYDHMFIEDINICIDDFEMRDLDFSGKNVNMALKSPVGLELTSLNIDQARVSGQRMELLGFNLTTPYSQMGDTLIFKYRCYESWLDFNNSIFIEGKLRDSDIMLGDIMVFAPALYKNDYFLNSERQILNVEGFIFGKINSLKGRKLRVKVGDQLDFKGSLSSRDLAYREQEIMGLGVDKLSFDITTLENLIPNFNLPQNFEKLGRINFKGRYDGYFKDFVVYGKLNSELGSADLDMRLDVKKGNENAEYSGNISLNEFNLGKWSANDDFGALSLDLSVQDGRGLSFESAYAELAGQIKKIEFKNYEYKDIDIDGSIKKNLFNGHLQIEEENASFTFDGLINNTDSIPVYDFSTDIKQLRLNKLNLAKSTFDFGGKGSMSIRGLNWDELIGSANLENVWMVYKESDTFNISKVDIAQELKNNGRKLNLISEIAEGQIEGIYDLKSMHLDVIDILYEHHPKLSELVKLNGFAKPVNPMKDYVLRLDLKDDKGIVEYFTHDRVGLKAVNFDLYVSLPNSSLKLKADMPELSIDNWKINDARVSLVNEKKLLISDINAGAVTKGNTAYFDNFSFLGNVLGDRGRVHLSYDDPNGVFDTLAVHCQIEPEDDAIAFTFDESRMSINDRKWNFKDKSTVVLGKKYIRLDDFSIVSDTTRIQFDDAYDNKGVKFNLVNIHTDLIDSLIHLNGFDFDGVFTATGSIENIYKFEGGSISLIQDDLLLNGESRGRFELFVNSENPLKRLEGRGLISNGVETIDFNGHYEIKAEAPDDYLFNIDLEKYPLKILEYVIRSGMSGTKGHVNGNLIVKGQGPDFALRGEAYIYEGKTRVDYLGVNYYFDDQLIELKDNFIDFSKAEIRDSLGNVASFRGGLYHKKFTKMEAGFRRCFG